MLRKEETNELVKRVTAASLKAIAAQPELNVKFAPGQSSATAEEAVLPTPVGPIIRMFFGVISSRSGSGTRCRRHRLRSATATARFASACPTM